MHDAIEQTSGKEKNRVGFYNMTEAFLSYPEIKRSFQSTDPMVVIIQPKDKAINE
jgi:hypothetical protein